MPTGSRPRDYGIWGLGRGTVPMFGMMIWFYGVSISDMVNQFIDGEARVEATLRGERKRHIEGAALSLGNRREVA